MSYPLSSVIEKFFGLCFVVLSVLICFVIFQKQDRQTKKNLSLQQEAIDINKPPNFKKQIDMANLKLNFQRNVQKVTLKSQLKSTERNRILRSLLANNITTNKQGHFVLEVDVFNNSPKKNEQEFIFLQFGLVDIKSMNKVAEFSTTLSFSELDASEENSKKKPDETSASSGHK